MKTRITAEFVGPLHLVKRDRIKIGVPGRRMLVKKMDVIEGGKRRHAPTADRRDMMIVDAGRD